MKKKALIIGGSNGIGLTIAHKLQKAVYNEVNILDRTALSSEDSNISYYKFNLKNEYFSIFNKFIDIDTLVISAGFRRVDFF